MKPRPVTLAHTWASFVRTGAIESIKDRTIAKTTDLLLRLRNAVSTQLGHDRQTRRGRPTGAKGGHTTYKDGVTFEVTRKVSNMRSIDTSRVLLAALVLSKRRRGSTPIDAARLNAPKYTIEAPPPLHTTPPGSTHEPPRLVGSPLITTLNGGPTPQPY